MNNLKALDYGGKFLKKNKISSYNIDSELLLSNIQSLSRENLLINLDQIIKKEDYYNYKKLLQRRITKEPIAYILKKKEFWKSKFCINENVLIPRPETEIIVEEILNMTETKSSKNILDVGTGSGCIILSIIKERPNCKGTAIDISKNALNVAKTNAKMHHLENKIKFENIDIDKFKHNKYDLIVSNPPYINIINYKRLEDNVKQFEPKLALIAGIDGLKIIKNLIIKSKKLLKRNGKLIFEFGENQEIKVKKLLMKHNFYVNKVCKDIRSFPRVIVSTKLF
ncbi:peptide chain release factor N(5)-glutamine methyltransferase [Candidatus Pelagibacter sp.]|nr:peptide chain release factor N(5)-glutamine methyltransferase [Candidatus Pelagibacter sp.]